MIEKINRFTEKYTSVERWFGRRVMPFLLGFCLCIFVLGMLGLVGDGTTKTKASILNDPMVSSVKNGTNSMYPGITYGEAFDNYFGNPKWDSFEGLQEDGTTVDVVEFSGTCMYQDVEVTALIQFAISEDGESFSATSLSFNDIPQNDIILSALLDDVFEDSSTELADSRTVLPEEDDYTEDGYAEDNDKEEYRTVEDSLMYPGLTGFYVTKEVATDYFVQNAESLTSFDCMEEFIDFKYGPIIFDFYVSRYTKSDEEGNNLAAMNVELYMRDDYGWSEEDYTHIVSDMRDAMYFSGDFSVCGNVDFICYNGPVYCFCYDQVGVFPYQDPL